MLATQTRRRATLLGCLIVLLIGVVVAVGLVLFLGMRGVPASRAALGPQVQILLPSSGSRLRARDETTVLVRAAGGLDVVRYELWIDGNLGGAREAPDPGGTLPDEYPFAWRPMLTGTHVLVVRATGRTKGSRTSRPVVVEVAPPARAGLVNLTYTVRPGETLESISAALGISLQDLREANPDAPETPEPGAEVTVPLPADRLPADYSGDDLGPDVAARAAPQPGPAPEGDGSGDAQPAEGGRPLQLLSDLGAPAPPEPPASLEVRRTRGCGIELAWSDNASSETGFRIYRYSGSSDDFLPIADLSANRQFATLVYEDQVPLGGDYEYYVASANAGGESPSPISRVEVPSEGCLPQADVLESANATWLQLEILNLDTTPASFDRVYCYLSQAFLGREHTRIPADEHAFLAAREGGWDIADYAAGVNRFVFAQPEDQPVQMSMECWAWSGEDLFSLGTFSASHPREDWDGLIPSTLRGSGAGDGGRGFRVEYRI